MIYFVLMVLLYCVCVILFFFLKKKISSLICISVCVIGPSIIGGGLLSSLNIDFFTYMAYGTDDLFFKTMNNVLSLNADWSLNSLQFSLQSEGQQTD